MLEMIAVFLTINSNLSVALAFWRLTPLEGLFR